MRISAYYSWKCRALHCYLAASYSNLLAEDSPLAQRLLDRVRSRLPGDQDEQKVWFWVILSLVSLAGLAVSGWYLLHR